MLTPPTVSSSGNTHEIDIISEPIAELRPGNSLETGEKFLQYIFDALDVGHFCEPPGTRPAVPPSEIFDERVARGRTVLSQALRGRHTSYRHETTWSRSVF